MFVCPWALPVFYYLPFLLLPFLRFIASSLRFPAHLKLIVHFSFFLLFDGPLAILLLSCDQLYIHVEASLAVAGTVF